MIVENKVLLQIGTNDGCDEFNTIVRKHKPSLVILVEPNRLLNEKINNNYNGHDVNCFTRHGEKYYQYGINGLNKVTEILESQGYQLKKIDSDTLAMNIKEIKIFHNI